MSDVTFAILKVTIAICSALITFFVVPYIHDLTADVRYSQIFQIVGAAVRAVEQTIRESGQGAVKKERVMQFIRKLADDQHFLITDEQISGLIEACVYEMKREAQ